jgi:hypothetical protein
MQSPQPQQDWQQWAHTLDLQRSNRRLVQQSRTPRQLRDVGWDAFSTDDALTRYVDSTLPRCVWAAVLITVFLHLIRG